MTLPEPKYPTRNEKRRTEQREPDDAGSVRQAACLRRQTGSTLRVADAFTSEGPKRFLLLLLLPALAAGLVTCGSSKQQAGTPQHFEAFDISGKPRSSTEWFGKQPVVLNFWGTWCAPCRREVPDLVRLYNEYAPKGIAMISLAVNDRTDRVEAFSKQYGMRWVMLMATRETLTEFDVVSAVPQTIFLDKSGREVKRLVGAKPYETLKAGFEELLDN